MFAAERGGSMAPWDPPLDPPLRLDVNSSVAVAIDSSCTQQFDNIPSKVHSKPHPLSITIHGEVKTSLHVLQFLVSLL